MNRKPINFMGAAKYLFPISIILMIISLGILTFKGLNYGIDFTGGTLLHLKFEKEVSISDLRKAVADTGLKVRIQPVAKGASFSQIGMGMKFKSDEWILSTVYLKDSGEGWTKAKFIKVLEDRLGVKVKEILKSSDVGPTIGKELKWKAIKAAVLALIFMMIYITYRFEFWFGFGAVFALVHDVLLTLAVFSLAGFEVESSFVAAILTLIGYSLNDSIVISDRIRENMKIRYSKDFVELINVSLTQTLRRTLNTSLTTLIPLTLLVLYGGPALFSFSFALWIGVLVGTYSSIFVVSPIVLHAQKGAWRVK